MKTGCTVATTPWGAVAVRWRRDDTTVRLTGLDLTPDGLVGGTGRAQIIDDLLAELLAGGPALWALDHCDWGRTPPFTRQILNLLARQVPRGQTTTYGALADRASRPGAARAVGAAMGRNPFPLLIPCHRCLAHGGALGGFQRGRPGGTALKARMLAWEGVEVAGGMAAL